MSDDFVLCFRILSIPYQYTIILDQQSILIKPFLCQNILIKLYQFDII